MNGLIVEGKGKELMIWCLRSQEMKEWKSLNRSIKILQGSNNYLNFTWVFYVQVEHLGEDAQWTTGNISSKRKGLCLSPWLFTMVYLWTPACSRWSINTDEWIKDKCKSVQYCAFLWQTIVIVLCLLPFIYRFWDKYISSIS